MKTLVEGVLVAAAMVGVVLCVSRADAQRESGGGEEPSRVFVRLGEVADFEGFDVEARGGEVVGLTVVRKGGRRSALKRQAATECGVGCPAGQKLSCWEETAEQLSICVCDGAATAIRKLPGQKKYTNIVLKRGGGTY
ncbi:MAG TPA: hypothetical protein VF588_16150 [Pyrinomonadaceae bacterium]|jgi:hypothetical protein